MTSNETMSIAPEREEARHERLREAEERFEQAFDHAPIGMALVEPNGRFCRVNRALCEIVGYEEDSLVGKTFQQITHPEDLHTDLEYVRQVLDGDRRTYQMEKRYLHADGREVWVMLSVSLVRASDGSPLHFISQIEDISGRKALEERLRHLASHDEMTGLLNRRRFDEELGRLVAYAKRYGHPGALLMIDLDNFKEVNDTLGHHVGDELVRAVAERLGTLLRATDLLGRLGGDEFGVFLPELAPKEAQRVACDLVDSIANDPFVVGALPLWTRTSIGVALFDPGAPADGPSLLMAADTAMYEAKRLGGHGTSVAPVRTDSDRDGIGARDAAPAAP